METKPEEGVPPDSTKAGKGQDSQLDGAPPSTEGEVEPEQEVDVSVEAEVSTDASTEMASVVAAVPESGPRSEPEPEPEPEPELELTVGSVAAAATLGEDEDEDSEEEELPFGSAAEAKAAGNEAFGAGNYDDAIVSFTWAIQFDGTQAAFYNNRSMTLTKLGRFQEAKDDGLKAADLDKSSGKGYFRAGQAATRMGEHEEALKLFSQAEAAQIGAAQIAKALGPERAHALGKLDRPMQSGTKVYIGGHGRGKITGFKRKSLGANEHRVALDSGQEKAFKLKEQFWSALVDEMAEMQAQAREESGAAMQRRQVEEAAAAERLRVEQDFAAIATRATVAEARAAGAVLRVSRCKDHRLNGWYKEVGRNQTGRPIYGRCCGAEGKLLFGSMFLDLCVARVLGSASEQSNNSSPPVAWISQPPTV
jgi:tetratricopeptide (TPR) repeat protein